MKTVGIIAEYNPFHKGHLYHINKIKEIYPDSILVLVMSSSFCQRGEPSIINKWDKTKIAIESGIDLVIELPFVFSTQSADTFAYGSTTLLEKLKVENLIFGSESNDIEKIKKLVQVQLNNEQFDVLTKIYMKMGENYPTALSKSLLDICGENITLPNDVLGISYVKAIMKNNYKLNPLCIKRTSSFHSMSLDTPITSASAIRKGLLENKSVVNNIPNNVIKYLEKPLHFQENYFKFLKYKIMNEDNISHYANISEGLDNKIKKNIISATSYDELIKSIKSKRYTYNKISRILNHILCNFKKCDNINKDIEYIRILGFNSKGQKYINKIKKEVDIPIISNFSKIKSPMIDIEFKATCTYASILEEDKKKELIELEYKNHPLR